MKPSHQTVLALSTSALVGLALRTRDCFAVDGAPRCLTVFRHPTLLFHPNNHLFYLVNVLAWTRMADLLQFKLSEQPRWTSFWPLTQQIVWLQPDAWRFAIGSFCG